MLWGQPPSDLANRLADFLAPGLAADQLEIVAPDGDVDVFASAELKRKLSGALDAGKTNVVVDLSAATFLDTTAIAAFVAASRRLRSVGGDLLVVNADESIARTLAISGPTRSSPCMRRAPPRCKRSVRADRRPLRLSRADMRAPRPAPAGARRRR